MFCTANELPINYSYKPYNEKKISKYNFKELPNLFIKKKGYLRLCQTSFRDIE